VIDEGHRGKRFASWLRPVLAEALLMGKWGGLIGSAFGILVLDLAGEDVFWRRRAPRWIGVPVSVGITIIVSIASAFPLRRLRADGLHMCFE